MPPPPTTTPSLGNTSPPDTPKPFFPADRCDASAADVCLYITVACATIQFLVTAALQLYVARLPLRASTVKSLRAGFWLSLVIALADLFAGGWYFGCSIRTNALIALFTVMKLGEWTMVYVNLYSWLKMKDQEAAMPAQISVATSPVPLPALGTTAATSPVPLPCLGTSTATQTYAHNSLQRGQRAINSEP